MNDTLGHLVRSCTTCVTLRHTSDTQDTKCLQQAGLPHPYLQLHPLLVPVDGLHLEVDAHRADEGRGEGVVGVAEQEGGLAHAAVADDQQLEHVVKVLVGRVPLDLRLRPGPLVSG